MYIYDTHYGKSSLADDETGIVVEWENGRFNETQTSKIDEATIAMLVPGGSTALASFVANRLRLMADYIEENYPETV